MRLNVRLIGSELKRSAEALRNKEHLQELEQELLVKRAAVEDGWGAKYRDRVRAKGKMTTMERIDALVDEGSPVHPVGTLVNWGREFAFGKTGRKAPGAGVFTVFARVQQRWVMIIANDNTVASGSWWPKTPEKIQRAQGMARRLRIPVIYLVDCSGFVRRERLAFLKSIERWKCFVFLRGLVD